VENTSGKNLYWTVFDLSTDGSINLYPPTGASELLPAGAKVKTDVIWRTAPPPGFETFKVVATTEKTDFSFLEQDAVTRSDFSPVEWLLGQALGRTRSVPEGKAAKLDEWATTQVNVMISDKSR
jgi:hypothetical protein